MSTVKGDFCHVLKWKTFAFSESMKLCPVCGNLLLVELSATERTHLFCQSCPYDFPVQVTFTVSKSVQKKKADDVLGGADAWADVQQTSTLCPKCSNDKAYFMQLQTRSADEPMTTFYKCASLKCKYRWKE